MTKSAPASTLRRSSFSSASGEGVAGAGGRVAAQAEDVAQPEHVRAEQVRLEREQVAVSRGDVEDRLQPQLLAEEDGHGERAHAHPRHRAIADVDAIDAGELQLGGASERPTRVQPPGRVNLDADDEA